MAPPDRGVFYVLSRFESSITSGCPKGILYKHYVYEWYINNRLFYIGVGTDRRAWKPHNPQAEEIRRSGAFKVKIVCDNLTKGAAHKQERFLVRAARNRGVRLYQRVPS